MRIAQVCPYSLSVPGGVQGQVLGLARALREAGHETRVLAPCDGPPPDPMVTPLGRSVPTAINGSIAPVAPDPACALRTIHSLRNEQFDVVHIHEPAVPGPSLTALTTSDAALVGTFHAAGAATAYNYYKLPAARLLRRLGIRTAVSIEAAATVESAVGGDYEILYNGIDLSRFSTSNRAQSSQPTTSERSSHRTILFVGRHEQRKGLSVLIDAMDYLPSRFSLRICGVGPQTSALQNATRGNHRITWLGRVTDAQRTTEMVNADFFCAPSLEGESFGIVLLESMAAGTPVVASDLSGYRLVAQGGKCAALVEPNNASALAREIEELSNNNVETQRLIVQGFARADEFSMSSLATRYVEIYERALTVKPTSRWRFW